VLQGRASRRIPPKLEAPLCLLYSRASRARSQPGSSPALFDHEEPIRVRYRQSSSHAFVALKTLDGTSIAMGEVTQTVHGDEVTSRLLLRFRNGSVDDDLTVFTQRGVLRLIKDHHVQHGPSFPNRSMFLWTQPPGRLPPGRAMITVVACVTVRAGANAGGPRLPSWRRS
jgi:hypothetical protein